MTLDILKNLLNNDLYFDKVFPYLKEEYFDIRFESMIFRSIKKYHEKYSFRPSESEIELLIENSSIPDDDREKLLKYYTKVKEAKTFDNLDFFVDETENFVQDADLKNALVKSIEIVREEPKEKQKIQDIISDSLSIHFDSNVGLDFQESIDERLEYYQQVTESGFKTGVEIIDKITNNGFKRKTLSVIAGEPHVGKTLLGTAFGTGFLLNSHDVLYITLELSENEVAKRIDSNMFDIKMSDLYSVDKQELKSNIQKVLSSGSVGRLIVKEYPTGGAGVGHFRALLKELKEKKNFTPDVIIVDYVGIMNSSADGMYENIKRNAEGLRAIAVENDLHVMTFAQVNRGGFSKAQPTMADLAESTGPAQIADFLAIIGKIQLDELAEETEDGIFKRFQHIYLNVVKSRYNGLGKDNIILLQDFHYMRLTEFKTDSQIEYEERKKSKSASGIKADMTFLDTMLENAKEKPSDVFEF